MSSTEDTKQYNSKKNPLTVQQLQQNVQTTSNPQKTRLGILPSENIKEKQVC
jgi:hypothetical protein